MNKQVTQFRLRDFKHSANGGEKYGFSKESGKKKLNVGRDETFFEKSTFMT